MSGDDACAFVNTSLVGRALSNLVMNGHSALRARHDDFCHDRARAWPHSHCGGESRRADCAERHGASVRPFLSRGKLAHQQPRKSRTGLAIVNMKQRAQYHDDRHETRRSGCDLRVRNARSARYAHGFNALRHRARAHCATMKPCHVTWDTGVCLNSGSPDTGSTTGFTTAPTRRIRCDLIVPVNRHEHAAARHAAAMLDTMRSSSTSGSSRARVRRRARRMRARLADACR